MSIRITLNRRLGHADGEMMPRELFGWVSPRRRTMLLATGWVLLASALVALTVGMVTGSGLLLAIGLAAGVLAWSLSASLPDPAPAPHPVERKRREAISRFSDHPVLVTDQADRTG